MPTWNTLRIRLVAVAGLLTAVAASPPAGARSAPEAPATALRRQAILGAIESVADWQLAHLSDRAMRPGGRRQKITGRGWIRCVFFIGVVAAHRATGESRYLEAATELGESNGWRLGPRADHADDHCIGQVYAELYLLGGEERTIAETRRRFDALLSRRRTKPLWAWADALFMSPPVAARLAAATGERMYLDWLTSSWRQTETALYDPDERLWYRDRDHVVGRDGFGPRTKNGAKVFWGRGNGWVLAGLVRVLEHLPSEHPGRHRFERLLREMASRLVEVQAADGLWRSSLLDPASFPQPEASGSALVAFGLAAGIRQGVLGEEYREPVGRAWHGLVGLVNDDGRLGWVQPVGRAPGPVTAADTAEYGAGAFLLAAEQVLALPPE